MKMQRLFLFFVLCIEGTINISNNSKVDYYKSRKKLFSNGDTLFYEGDSGNERLVQWTNDGKTWFYGKNENLVKIEYTNGSTWFYEGDSGNERLLKWINDGETWSYGKNEDLVKIEYANGETWYYGKNEDLVKIETNDSTWFYGENENLVKIEHNNGNTWFYGENEDLVKIKTNDSTWFYEGDSGNERLVRKEFSNWKLFYEGEFGNERLVKIEYTNGKTWNSSEMQKEFSNDKPKFYTNENEKNFSVLKSKKKYGKNTRNISRSVKEDNYKNILYRNYKAKIIQKQKNTRIVVKSLRENTNIHQLFILFMIIAFFKIVSIFIMFVHTKHSATIMTDSKILMVLDP